MIRRYSTPEMNALWSEEAQFQSWLDVEIAACEAWHELGRIPAEDLNTIKAKAKFDVDRILEIEKTTHHDVIAFTTNLAENIGPSSRFVHLGLTSSDVVDTALALRCKRAAELLESELAALTADLFTIAETHRHQVVIGRTHGIHGEPTTLGLKFLLYAKEGERNLRRLRQAAKTIGVGKISGAVGTYAHTGPEVERIVCERLGLAPAPVSTQVLQRDRHAEFVFACAVTAAGIEKIATEIRNLQKTEVREIEEPFAAGQKGSSAMPHKRNPVKCEQLCGLARHVRAAVMPALENIALWHERDISHSSVERIILPDVTTLLHYMLRQMRKVVNGLHFYPSAMRSSLEKTRGLIFSQKVLLALVDSGLSREDAYDVVQTSAMATWADAGTTFREQLMADARVRSVVSAEQLDELMDYRAFVQHVDAIYEQAREREPLVD